MYILLSLITYAPCESTITGRASLISVNANHGRPNMTRPGSRLHQTVRILHPARGCVKDGMTTRDKCTCFCCCCYHGQFSYPS